MHWKIAVSILTVHSNKGMAQANSLHANICPTSNVSTNIGRLLKAERKMQCLNKDAMKWIRNEKRIDCLESIYAVLLFKIQAGQKKETITLNREEKLAIFQMDFLGNIKQIHTWE